MNSEALTTFTLEEPLMFSEPNDVLTQEDLLLQSVTLSTVGSLDLSTVGPLDFSVSGSTHEMADPCFSSINSKGLSPAKNPSNFSLMLEGESINEIRPILTPPHRKNALREQELNATKDAKLPSKLQLPHEPKNPKEDAKPESKTKALGTKANKLKFSQKAIKRNNAKKGASESKVKRKREADTREPPMKKRNKVQEQSSTPSLSMMLQHPPVMAQMPQIASTQRSSQMAPIKQTPQMPSPLPHSSLPAHPPTLLPLFHVHGPFFASTPMGF